MDIEYRTYEPGDEKDLADVFNYAFQSLGGGMLRTPKGIIWRYLNRPHGKTKEIHVAYDKEKRRVISSIFATVEHCYFRGKKYRVGCINDVGTLPSYTGKGISKRLMQNSMDFFQSENCDYSSLVADPNGHPRKKIYEPAGFQEYCKQYSYFNIGNPLIFTRHLPLFIPLFPALGSARLFNTIETKINHRNLSKNQISFHIYHTYFKNQIQPLKQELSEQLWNLHSKVGIQQYDAFEPFDKEEWRYFREQPIMMGLYPSFVVAFWNEKPIGMVSFTRQWIYAVKLGLHFPLAFMRDIVVDHSANLSADIIGDIYKGLALTLCTAASQRNCGVIIINTTPTFSIWNSSLHSIGAFSVPFYASFMMKQMKKDLQLPLKSNRPIIISPGENYLSP